MHHQFNRTHNSAAARRLLALIAAVLSAHVLLPDAAACPIPVFQYALEHWEADPYHITIYHSGELAGEHQQALELLNASMNDLDQPANIRLDLIDVAVQEAGRRFAKLPHFEVRYPIVSGARREVWSGSLTLGAMRQLLDSPARRSLSNEILEGQSAVWILLESGDRAKDNAAAELLAEEIKRLQNTLVLPDLAAWGHTGNPEDVLRPISFSMKRIRREDPAEAVFVRMLLASEPDLAEFAGEPIVFPIYGRGLILYALVGRGINRGTITRAAEFLTGPCSCQVKAGNPGLDLLMRVNWEDTVEKRSRAALQAPVGAAGFIDKMQEAEEKLEE